MELLNKVAIIILNWNSYEDTYECLKSIENLDFKDFTVFLVDNNSQDNSFEKLKNAYAHKNEFNFNIEFIENNENLGFAGGNNQGIKKAYDQGYQYFWLLNNDTIVEKSSLSALINVFKLDKDIGIVGSKILYYSTNKIWFAGGKINYFTGATKHIGIKEEDLGQYNTLCEVDYITGCSLCFSRSMLEKTGYMIEDYFLYYEETDWNIRAKKHGFKIVYTPESVVYHKVSASSGGIENPKPYTAYYDLRNAIVMIKRTQKPLNYYLTLLYSIYKAFKHLVKIIVRKQDNKILRTKYIIRGLLDGINMRMGKHPVLK